MPKHSSDLNKEAARDAVDASPSKNFFVEMLTRDIELKDSILDLLDNCLDGVIRTLGERKRDFDNSKSDPGDKPYSGFGADIDFDKHHFRISDNCGGMTREILERHAFRLGRPALERDKDLATVGLYGIGMKRAIFKLGRSCTVTTRHNDEAYRVTITSDWLNDDDNWHLPIESVDHRGIPKGTTIEVRDLKPEVMAELNRNKNKEFSEDLRALISTHYSYIIHKGFRVRVNSNDIRPRELHLRFNSDVKQKEKIAPFMFQGLLQGVIGKVKVDLAVGLYRSLPSTEELDQMDAGSGFRKENAGWTVICNDRVVLYNDTSHLTGWGEGNVPKYHTQFIAIAGVVRFYSNNPSDLPLTTTKRGINLNSPLYAEVKNVMRQGTKHFTDFTNRWKRVTLERQKIYEETASVEPLSAFDLVKPKEWKTSKKYDGKMFVPELPKPREVGEQTRIIRFSRPKEVVEKLAIYLFDDPTTPPGQVGERCFDDYYKLAKSETESI